VADLPLAHEHLQLVALARALHLLDVVVVARAEPEGVLPATRRELAGDVVNWVELLVTDTGPGIPQKVLSNLFVPFVTTKDRGTGLGLAISQRIVTSAGGFIEVRSDEGVGTTFVVRLPAVGDRDPTGEVKLPRQRVSSPPMGASSSSGATASRGDGLGDLETTGGEVPTSLATSR